MILQKFTLVGRVTPALVMRRLLTGQCNVDRIVLDLISAGVV